MYLIGMAYNTPSAEKKKKKKNPSKKKKKKKKTLRSLALNQFPFRDNFFNISQCQR
jgi:hypothetical protein